MKPEVLRHKVFEPVLFIGKAKVKNLDIRLRVKGGGHVSQIYGEQRGGSSSSSGGSRSVVSRGQQQEQAQCVDSTCTQPVPGGMLHARCVVTGMCALVLASFVQQACCMCRLAGWCCCC